MPKKINDKIKYINHYDKNGVQIGQTIIYPKNK